MLKSSSAPSLHVVTGTTAPPPRICQNPRCPLPSRPSFTEDDSDAGVPTSNMLLTSLCDAWHDIGARTSHLLSAMQPPKAKPV